MTLPQNTTNSDKSHSRLHPWLKIFLYIGLIAVIIGVAYRFYGVFSSTSEHSHYVVEQPVAATIVKKSHLPVILTELGQSFPFPMLPYKHEFPAIYNKYFSRKGNWLRKMIYLPLLTHVPQKL